MKEEKENERTLERKLEKLKEEERKIQKENGRTVE